MIESSHPLATLANAKYTFYPTGSRYFGGATNESDWDFYAEDTNEVRAFLIDVGFVELPFNLMLDEYNDPNICAVFRHSQHVDVQLTRYLDERRRAHAIMKTPDAHCIYLILNKQQRHDLWRLIYSMSRD